MSDVIVHRQGLPPLTAKYGTIFLRTSHTYTAWEGTAFEEDAHTNVWREEPGTIGMNIEGIDAYMLDADAKSIALAILALLDTADD